MKYPLNNISKYDASFLSLFSRLYTFFFSFVKAFLSQTRRQDYKKKRSVRLFQETNSSDTYNDIESNVQTRKKTIVLDSIG